MAGFVVEEVDGTPSLSSITILQFDQGDGFALTQPVAGTVRVDFTPTSAPDEEAQLLTWF